LRISIAHLCNEVMLGATILISDQADEADIGG
jgi:hypothetical protein